MNHVCELQNNLSDNFISGHCTVNSNLKSVWFLFLHTFEQFLKMLKRFGNYKEVAKGKKSYWKFPIRRTPRSLAIGYKRK